MLASFKRPKKGTLIVVAALLSMHSPVLFIEGHRIVVVVVVVQATKSEH